MCFGDTVISAMSQPKFGVLSCKRNAMISLMLYALLMKDCLLALIHRQVHVLLAFLRAFGLSDLMTQESER